MKSLSSVGLARWSGAAHALGHSLTAHETNLLAFIELTAAGSGPYAGAAARLCRNAEEHRLAAETLATALYEAQMDEKGRSLARPGPIILVVEDHEDARMALVLVLTQAGFTVRTAADGLDALLVAHQEVPAVVVMDLRMPILDGWEATRLLKASAATKDADVIAYTAERGVATDPRSAMFCGILTKPADPEAVLAAVRACVAA